MATRTRNTNPIADAAARAAIRALKPGQRRGTLTPEQEETLADARAVAHWRSRPEQVARFLEAPSSPSGSRSSGPSSGGSGGRPPSRPIAMTGTPGYTLATRKDGSLAHSYSNREQAFDRNTALATRASTKQVNNSLAPGQSLRPGPGMAVVDYRRVEHEGVRDPYGHPMFREHNGRSEYLLERGETYIPVYGRVSGAQGSGSAGPGYSGRAHGSSGSTSAGGSGSRPGSAGSGGFGSGGKVTTESMLNARLKAENALYGRNSSLRPPDLFPDGYTEGNAISDVADYGNRLNRNTIRRVGAMNDRAVATGYETGSILRTALTGLPAGPRPAEPGELLGIAESAAGLFDFGLEEEGEGKKKL